MSHAPSSDCFVSWTGLHYPGAPGRSVIAVGHHEWRITVAYATSSLVVPDVETPVASLFTVIVNV